MFPKIKEYFIVQKARKKKKLRHKELLQQKQKEEESNQPKGAPQKSFLRGGMKDNFFLGMVFPYIMKEKRQKGDAATNIGIMISCGVVAAGILFIFFSAFFRIQDVQVDIENHSLVNATEIYEFLDQYKKKSTLFLNTRIVEHETQKYFEAVAEVSCDKVFPKILRCKIGEYKPALVLQKGDEEDKEYIINQAGQVVSTRAKVNDDKYITVITSNAEDPIEVGSHKMTPEIIDFIYTAKNKFEDRIGARVVSVWWLEREREIHLYTNHGFPIYLSLFRDVQTQLSDLISVFSYYDFEGTDVEYIDLRVKGKVFYK